MENYMRQKRDQDFFNQLISGFDSKLQSQLRYQYMHNQIINNLENSQQLERMKREIVEEVLRRIYIEIDTSEAIDKINGLGEAIQRLGQ